AGAGYLGLRRNRVATSGFNARRFRRVRPVSTLVQETRLMFRWILSAVLALAILAAGSAPQLGSAARADNAPGKGQRVDKGKGKGKKGGKHKRKRKGRGKGRGKKGGNKAGGSTV